MAKTFISLSKTKIDSFLPLRFEEIKSLSQNLFDKLGATFLLSRFFLGLNNYAPYPQVQIFAQVIFYSPTHLRNLYFPLLT